MPRLLAIAQEFEIPTFVVCDSDIESSIKSLERTEQLHEDEPSRTEKIRSRRENLKKQKEVNKAIASLCCQELGDQSKCETIKGDNIVMWRDAIGTEVESSFAEAEWQETQNEVTKKYGFEEVRVRKKNGMVIAATLQELHKKGKQSSALIELGGRISQYAQRAESRGKI